MGPSQPRTGSPEQAASTEALPTVAGLTPYGELDGPLWDQALLWALWRTAGRGLMVSGPSGLWPATLPLRFLTVERRGMDELTPEALAIGVV